MQIKSQNILTSLLMIFAGLAAPSASRAAIYSESVSGDLSNDRLSPTSLALSISDNTIAGNIVAGDLDYFTVIVPSAAALSAIVLQDYQSSNARAFLGMQAGSTFTVAPEAASAGDLLGYTHFGFDTLVGGDLLDNLDAPDAIGFTAPLGPGPYTFWVNQTEPAPTGYQFNFVIIPEPAPLSLLALALLASLRLKTKAGNL